MSFVDLHIHSDHSSDGEWSVERICSQADRLGLAAFSISDHDTVRGVEEAWEMRSQTRAHLVPNVEISTGHKGRKYHLLSPLVDWRSRELREFLARIREARARQARGRVRNLRKLGYDISFEEVERAAEGASMTGPAIAEVLLGKEESRRDARLQAYYEESLLSPQVRFYKDHFRPGGKAYAPRQEAPLEQAIELVRRLGGVPVLAHPGQRRPPAGLEVISEMREMGLQGLEVHTSYHDDDTAARYLELARELDLVATAGSDFHGSAKPQVEFGSVRQGGWKMIERLRERRRAGL